MPPLHVHHRDDETFYVLEGDGRLFLRDREIVPAPGQAALAPRGVPHTYRVESDRARWIVINSPAGFEQLLRAASEPAPGAELPPAGRHGDPAEAETAQLCHWLDIQAKRNVVLTFGGGVNEIQRELIATAGLGLPRVPR